MASPKKAYNALEKLALQAVLQIQKSNTSLNSHVSLIKEEVEAKRRPVQGQQADVSLKTPMVAGLRLITSGCLSTYIAGDGFVFGSVSVCRL